FPLPNRLMGCGWRERHRALGWCRGPSSRDGDLRGRVPALAQGTNHLAPRLSSNRRQSPVSPCVSATRTRRAFSFGSHGPMTRLESLGVLAAMIFIAALIVGTAFPALLCLACCPRGADNRCFMVRNFRDLGLCHLAFAACGREHVDDFTHMASAGPGRLGLFRGRRLCSDSAGHAAWSRNLC